MKATAKIFSVLMHPLLLVFLLVTMAYWIDRYAYYFSDSKEVGLMMIMNFALLVLFPMVGVAMLAGLKMISGVTMPLREDRIGPLIITLTFYIWYFVNVLNSPTYPDTLRFAALGVTLTAGLAFFINNFSKISLHTIGASSFTVALILLIVQKRASFIDIDLMFVGSYRVSAIFVILLSILLTGLIGTCRLYLSAHRPNEVYGGYIAGVFAQLIAYRIILA